MKKTQLETSNHYNHPYRPLPIRWFNSAGKLADHFGLLSDLDVNQLIANARRKTGLQDFGDEWFREPLGVLVDSINREAHLTPLGKLIQKNRLEGALAVRLRAAALCKAHPEIERLNFGKIVVIAGLQRTGTTTLHRLLAADPDMRALYAWEALNPLPLPNEKPGKPTARMTQAKVAEKGLAYLAPEFFAIHPVEHDAPEEDVLLLDLSFMSQSPEATLHVPTYAAWLEKQDHTRAYEYLRKMLKILQWQRGGKNWVLKTPHHMEYLDVILKVFPEAVIVQTHRDPQKTTGSFCSMVSHGRGVFSDEVDAREVARHWVRKVNRLMQLSIDVRERLGEERFIDVSYYDLLKDPIHEVERIYQFAGIPFDAKVAHAAQATSERNVQHRFGHHRYNLADFGLSKEDIEKQYGFYRQRYGIPYEK